MLSLKARPDLVCKLDNFQRSLLDNTYCEQTEDILDFIQKNKANIPAYAGYGQLNHFNEIPLINKSTIAKYPGDFINRDFNDQRLWKKSTSGTSGKPIDIYYSIDFYLDYLFLTVPKIIVATNHKHTGNVCCVHVTDTNSSSNWIMLHPIEGFGAIINVVIDQSSPSSFDLLSGMLNRFRPTAIASRPELLELITLRLDPLLWKSMEYKPAFIISSGNELDEYRRKRISDFFNCAVVNSYVLSEFGLVAIEKGEQGFLVDDAMHIEIINEEGCNLDSGSAGEIVISSIANKAMPLVRYRTGDYGCMDAGGDGRPRFKIFKGRQLPSFCFEAGKMFSPSCFNNLFQVFTALTEYQVNQVAANEVEVLVQFDSSIIDEAEFLLTVSTHVKTLLPVHVSVHSKAFDFNYQSKFQRYGNFVTIAGEDNHSVG